MPNNAIVVMAGDFDTKKAVGICQKYFGVYPAGKLEQHYTSRRSRPSAANVGWYSNAPVRQGKY